MTDNKVSDADIKKALECCIESTSRNDCEDLKCPACDEIGCYFMNQSTEYYPESLIQEMGKAVLDLINRKDEEIINRTEEYNDMLEQRNKVEEALEVMTMDVNSLTSERDALQEMVKEQKAEIERLNVELVGMRGACESYKIHYDNAQAEIERLNDIISQMLVNDAKIGKALLNIKSEAYKEFAERLHQKCKKYPYTLPSVFTNIEITYKELTEGGNEPPKNDFKAKNLTSYNKKSNKNDFKE